MEAYKDIICLYKNDCSTEALSYMLSVSITQIRNILLKNDVKIRKGGRRIGERKYCINDGAFSGKLTEDKAYWLGFLMTDGCVGFGTNRVRLEMGRKDHGHLIKFKKSLNTNNKIFKRERFNKIVHRVGLFSTIDFNSDKIRRELSKYGIVPRKTYIAKALNGIENNKHFWRGVVDGDGCIIVNNKEYLNFNLCGTEEIIKQFISFVNRDIIRTDKKPKRRGDVFLIWFSSRNGGKILNHLYGKSKINLNRKSKKFLKYLKICKKKRVKLFDKADKKVVTVDSKSGKCSDGKCGV